MYKILSLVCILAALLTALFLTSWVKSKRGTGEETARLYGIIKSRNSNFWGFHYIPVIAFLLLAVLASGLGTGWLNAAACLAGGIITFASVYAGSLVYVSGSVSSHNAAVSSDIRTSIKASYRTGAVFLMTRSA